MTKYFYQNKKFKIEIAGFDTAKKLNIIKEIKAMLNLGLKESKELIEKLPALVKKDVPKEETDKLKEKLEALGCQVSIT